MKSRIVAQEKVR